MDLAFFAVLCGLIAGIYGLLWVCVTQRERGR